MVGGGWLAGWLAGWLVLAGWYSIIGFDNQGAFQMALELGGGLPRKWHDEILQDMNMYVRCRGARFRSGFDIFVQTKQRNQNVMHENDELSQRFDILSLHHQFLHVENTLHSCCLEQSAAALSNGINLANAI